MNEKEISKIWRTLTKSQKTVLYVYLSLCKDVPSSAAYLDPKMKRLAQEYGWTAFYMKVEELGFANYRKEVNAILEGIGDTSLIHWMSTEKYIELKILWQKIQILKSSL
ncbi:MAG: hypothetical protein IJP62_10290 [Treponema sp.]|nr:hypothetical protein [Treponema sp.]